MERIDLSKFTVDQGGRKVRNLGGFDFGRAIRELIELDTHDKSKGPEEIYIPAYVDYIDGTFLDGLFGPSADTFPGRVAFLKHYSINCNDSVLEEDINPFLIRALGP